MTIVIRDLHNEKNIMYVTNEFQKLFTEKKELLNLQLADAKINETNIKFHKLILK